MRVLAINVLILFVLFNAAYWSLPLVWLVVKSASVIAFDDVRGRLPNYASVDWGPTHYREFDELRTQFKSNYGWRRKPYRGTTIEIDGPYAQRRTTEPASPAGPRTVYFFGGSTMWGTGADNAGTIPSQFATMTGLRSENFAETGYTAHQGLSLLIQLLQEGHRPDLVVFYDGVNDVAHKCRRELGPDSYMLEAKLAQALNNSPAVTFGHYVAPILHAAGFVATRMSSDPAQEFDCRTDPAKARRIAENLVHDWQMARDLVELRGGKFIAVLQPVVYFSRTRTEHLKDSNVPILRGEFETVYPLIRQLAKPASYHDLTGALDADEYIYVDFAHVSPNGNRRIAAQIADLAKHSLH